MVIRSRTFKSRLAALRGLQKSALKVRSRHLNISSDDHITFDSTIVPKLWIPDLVFLGTTNEKRHTVIRNNDMLRVTPRGQILLSQRFTLEMDCHMDFHQFPFDYQLCPIELESFGYTTKGTALTMFQLTVRSHKISLVNIIWAM